MMVLPALQAGLGAVRSVRGGRPRGRPHRSGRSGGCGPAATTPEGVTLTHTAPAPGERDDRLVLSAGILANVEGGTDDPVSADRQSKLHAVVRWADRDGPHSTPTDLILPGKQHELPEPPAFSPVGAGFLTALHECGRTAAKDSGRFALSKIQIQGKTGRMIGTDGKRLLWDGFTCRSRTSCSCLPFPCSGPRNWPGSPLCGLGRQRPTWSSPLAHGRCGCRPTPRRAIPTWPGSSPGRPMPRWQGSTNGMPRSCSANWSACPGPNRSTARSPWTWTAE